MKGRTGTPPISAGLPAGPVFYASPSGSSLGDGSVTRPWVLQTALDQPATVTAGSTIWLRGGRYVGGRE